jgi:hypothetical protein
VVPGAPRRATRSKSNTVGAADGIIIPAIITNHMRKVTVR